MPRQLDLLGMGPEDVEEQDGVWTVRLRVPEWGGGVFDRLSVALASIDVLGVDVAPVRLEDVYATVMDRLSADETASTRAE